MLLTTFLGFQHNGNATQSPFSKTQKGNTKKVQKNMLPYMQKIQKTLETKNTNAKNTNECKIINKIQMSVKL